MAFLATALAFGSALRTTSAGEVGFLETFALAENRDDALRQLVPGTQEYYYFHALHYQQQERYADVEAMLKPWIERHGYSALVNEILHRQALLKYPQQPKESLEYVRNQLSLQFQHQRETLREKPNFPTGLDQSLLSIERLADRALANRQDIGGFRPVAFDWLAVNAEKMDAGERRSLLASLERPTLPNLVDLIVADLQVLNHGTFGALPIHSKLTKEQLDDLMTELPHVRGVREFVHAYLQRLVANDDVDVIDDAQAFVEQIDRQYDFAKTLAPSFNSLKAHLLYQRLEFDRSQGIYDRERFMEYVKLPRFMPYVNGEWMAIQSNRDHAVNVNEDYRYITGCEPIGSDVQLVKDFLSHFFLTQNDFAEFAPFIREDFLRRILAETKIVHGLGEQERWASILSPEQFKALKERVDIDFAYVNPERYEPQAPVALDVFVKNVPTLIVKVFEIDERNWYADRLSEIDTSIELDGLTPNFEQTYQYDESPLLRVQRHFEFPMLTGRGIYVIDFIGAGQASRALIRKGRLRYVSHTTPAGHVFQVLDEKNQLLKDASILMGGVEYAAQNDAAKGDAGRILVPFSTNPGQIPIVLLHGDFATLEHFRHDAENYELHAGLYIDRESLIKQKTAKVIVRPQLTLNGEPISLKLLEEIKLTVVTQDASGTTAAMEEKDFVLFEDRESVYEFRVPADLRNVTVRLEAKVPHLQRGDKIPLGDQQVFQVNQVSDTSQIAVSHLTKLPSGYVLFVLGKTGEAIVDHPVQLTIEHRWFTDPIHTTLKTDARGAVALGHLPGILRITASQGESSRSWDLPTDRVDRRMLYHLTTQDVLRLPYLGNAQDVGSGQFSLLEIRKGNYVRDAAENLSLTPGYLVVTKLAPGDYELFLEETQERIQLRVTQGTAGHGYLLGDGRLLEATRLEGLQLISVERGEIELSKLDGPAEEEAPAANGEEGDELAENDAEDEEPAAEADAEMAAVLKLKVGGASKFARVHIIADRFLPAFSAFDVLSDVRSPEATATTIPDPRSFYLVGRNIGDEYRYIIDRKYARKFAGNMLERPSLLLNPWAIRSTATDVQLAAEGGEFSKELDSRESNTAAAPADAGGAAGGLVDPADLDFLASTSVHLLNLVPDEEGFVYVPIDLLEGCGFVQAIAVDPTQTVYRTLVAPEGSFDFRDLRLRDGLDPKGHFAQTRKIEVLTEGDALVLPDVAVAELETYDSIASVFELLLSASGNPTLAEFGFLPRWNTLPAAEKKTLYSKYACHELHFFLAEKDPAFFEQIVRPYLANKKEKTFFDRFLLGEDLKEYTNPWQYQRLNVVEKILLSRRIEGDPQHVLTWMQNRLDVMPPNPDAEKALFEQALGARGLRTGTASLAERLSRAQSARQEAQALAGSGEANGIADVQLQMNWAIPNSGPQGGAMSGMGGGIGGGGFGGGMGGFGGALGAPAAARPAMAPAPAAEPAMNAPMELAAAADELKKAEKQNRFMEGEGIEGKSRLRRLNELRGAIRDKSGRADDAEAFYDIEGVVAERELVRQLYRPIDQTMEYVESNYWRLAKESMTQELIGPSEFWRDFAAADPAQPFRSTQIARPTRNIHEMLLALGAIDLPFEAAEHETTFDEARMELRPQSPTIAFYRQIEAVEPVENGPEILLSQNFFQATDRYRMEGGERLEKFIYEEFVAKTVYGCQLVLTNPTSSPQRLEALLQIPEGAMPLAGTKRTETRPVDLGAYSTTTLEYYFYFPTAGRFEQFPVHVSRRGDLIAFAEPFTFNVLEEPSKIDTQSWAYISQYGTDAEVLAYLQQANLAQTDLSKIAFRMKDKAFFEQTLALLEARHAYDRTLWSYAVLHNVPERVQQFLAFEEDFVRQVGLALDSPLLVVDPIERNFYEHREYKPLVNARRHKLGPHWTILNDRFYEHYTSLMKRLSYVPELTDLQRLEVTYYLLLQDRVAEALEHFAKVEVGNVDTKLQYDYCLAYLQFSQERPEEAREIAAQYRDYPVERWRNLFASIERQVEEIGGKPGELVDEKDRDQQMAQLAATQPTFDLRVEGGKMRFNHQALDRIQISYYLMDLELLFSRNPFVKEFSGEFSYIKPNLEQTVELPGGQKTTEVPLPPALGNQNVLVLASAAGRDQAVPYYSNSLDVQTFDAYGQIRVLAAGTDQPLAKAYVKVYSRRSDGSIRFYKDGYTDLRGRFDYASLSTSDLDSVERFAILVMSDEHGAVVKELEPPKR
ncbi:MAG TPA: hypothetical protein VGN57_14970 [Pirellulaceae bacterium]|nr:hypothetical protein [Pirellulaceae bacterium]